MSTGVDAQECFSSTCSYASSSSQKMIIAIGVTWSRGSKLENQSI